MPEIKVILKETGKNNMVLTIQDTKSLADFIERIYKSKCISKRDRAKYELLHKGNQILPSVEAINNSSIKNMSEIEIKEKRDKEMERGKEDWTGWIIEGSIKSLILNNKDEEQFFSTSLRDKVQKRISNKIYCASQDGDTAQIFHKKCDNKGPLLYLIKTKNDLVFGIYTSKSIRSDNVTRNDSTQMVICPYKNFAVLSLNGNSTYHCYPDKGALFHCMQINTPFLSSNCVDICSCDNFQLPSYPSGNSSYQIKELEVYTVDNSN